MLLAIALPLQAIPLIEWLGLLIGLIGAILMILGSPAFGPRHQTLVWISVGLYVLAELMAFLLGAAFASSMISAGTLSGSQQADAFLAAFDGFLAGAVVSIALIGISCGLIAFALVNRGGKALLAAGAAATIVGAIVSLFAILEPWVRSLIEQAYATNPPNTQLLIDGAAQVRLLWMAVLLNLIGPLVFTVAYGWAAVRIASPAAAPPAPTPS